MAGVSDTYELVTLQAAFGTGHYSGFPGTYHLGLFNVSPTDSTFGTEVATVGANGYARVAITNDDAEWDTSVAPVTNLNQEDFGPVTTTDWLVAAYWALLDHASATAAANIVFYGTFATAKTCEVGESPFVPVGGLTIGAD